MKTTALLCVLLALAPGAYAANPTIINTTGSQPIRLPDITVASELTELAAGYAKAFKSMERRPVNIVLQTNNRQIPDVMNDVANLTPFGGALRIELRSGLNYVVSARDVVAITDDTRVKP